MQSNKDTKKNIETLIDIRDNISNLPAVRVQAIQTMQKLISEDSPETNKNIEVLRSLRDDETVNNAVRIQTIQTMQKIIDLVSGEVKDDRPTEADIMAKIRSKKK